MNDAKKIRVELVLVKELLSGLGVLEGNESHLEELVGIVGVDNGALLDGH